MSVAAVMNDIGQLVVNARRRFVRPVPPEAAAALRAQGDLPGHHQDPIFVIPGLSASRWMYTGGKEALEAQGFMVGGMKMPWHGWSGIPSDAAYLRKAIDDFIDQARAQGRDVTRVQLVGDSEGGLIARWFLQFGDGQDLVSRLVTNGTPHGGIRPLGSDFLANFAQKLPGVPDGVKDLLVSSPIMRDLNDDWMDFIRYARREDPNFEVHSIGSRVFGMDHDGLVPTHATRLGGGEGMGVFHYLTQGGHSLKFALGSASESLNTLMAAVGHTGAEATEAAALTRGVAQAWDGANQLRPGF